MRWAREHPEEMAEIAAFPLSAQGAALAAEIELSTPDRDRTRDELKCNCDLSYGHSMYCDNAYGPRRGDQRPVHRPSEDE